MSARPLLAITLTAGGDPFGDERARDYRHSPVSRSDHRDAPSSSAEDAPPVRYLTVELGPDGIAEWADGNRAVFVPRDTIVGIELRRGIGGERPIVQIVLGSALVAAGIVLLGALTAIYDMPRGTARLAAAGAPLAIWGVYVLWTALRPALFLLVRTKNDRRKVLFQGRADLASVRAVLDDAKARFDYDVTWAVPKPEQSARPYRS